MSDRYEGTCDTCGQPISLDHDRTTGTVDIWVEGEKVGTWIRHRNGPEPGCDRYFSRVVLVTASDSSGEADA